MSAALKLLIKLWPALTALALVFSTWGLYDAHKDKKELRRQIALADKRYEAASDTLAQRDAQVLLASRERDAARAELRAVADDGCLDRGLPDPIRRLLGAPRTD